MPRVATLSRVGVPTAAPRARLSARAAEAGTGAMVEAVGTAAARRGRCTPPRARTAGTRRRCRSNPAATSLCTVRTASSNGVVPLAAATAAADPAAEVATKCRAVSNDVQRTDHPRAPELEIPSTTPRWTQVHGACSPRRDTTRGGWRRSCATCASCATMPTDLRSRSRPRMRCVTTGAPRVSWPKPSEPFSLWEVTKCM